MKKIVRIYVRFVQRILITIFLTLLYFLVFSITRFFMMIFPGKYYKRKYGKDTFWIPAEGYEADLNAAEVQS